MIFMSEDIDDVSKYYKILGLNEDATKEEVRSKYIELIKKIHPDVSKNSNAEEITEELNEAYKVLMQTANKERTIFANNSTILYPNIKMKITENMKESVLEDNIRKIKTKENEIILSYSIEENYILIKRIRFEKIDHKMTESKLMEELKKSFYY